MSRDATTKDAVEARLLSLGVWDNDLPHCLYWMQRGRVLVVLDNPPLAPNQIKAPWASWQILPADVPISELWKAWKFCV